MLTCLSVCLSVFVCVYSAFAEVYWSFTLLPLSYLKLGAREERLCNILLSLLLSLLRSPLLMLMLILLLFLFSLQEDTN